MRHRSGFWKLGMVIVLVSAWIACIPHTSSHAEQFEFNVRGENLRFDIPADFSVVETEPKHKIEEFAKFVTKDQLKKGVAAGSIFILSVERTMREQFNLQSKDMKIFEASRSAHVSYISFKKEGALRQSIILIDACSGKCAVDVMLFVTPKYEPEARNFIKKTLRAFVNR